MVSIDTSRPGSLAGNRTEQDAMNERCARMSSCVRLAGHAGACTACPSSATLDWDLYRSSLERNEEMLRALDWPSPPWADLLDDEEAA